MVGYELLALQARLRVRSPRWTKDENAIVYHASPSLYLYNVKDGSTIKVSFDNAHPLGWGMPEEGLVLFWDSPAFEIQPSRNNDDYETVVRYAEKDLLQSGWLIGEDHLAKRAAMVSARHGEGRVVLIGFRAQHRAQTHGTYKLLFNALLGS